MTSFFNPGSWSLKIKKTPPLNANASVQFQALTQMRAASPLAGVSSLDYAEAHLKKLTDARKDFPAFAILDALMVFFEDVYYAECLSEPPEAALKAREGSSASIELGDHMRRQMALLQDVTHTFPAMNNYLQMVTQYLLDNIPNSALTIDANMALFKTDYAARLKDAPEVIDKLIKTTLQKDYQSLGILETLRNQLERNVMRASKIDPNNPPSNIHKYVMPPQMSGVSAEQLVDIYLKDTPYQRFFQTELPLDISERARLEHCYILAGSGHGKTQLIQKFLVHDLIKALQENHSIVVMDSQGDLISRIANLEIFDPDIGVMAGKLVIIDPSDVAFPAAINMFAMDEARMEAYGPAEREKVQNSAIELYEHFFGELLGAELTARQGMVFKYLARLMLEIPNATIITLRDLMDDPKPFIPYMDKLSGSARVFFAREFFSPSFNATKKQISKRLWGVLSTPAFERLFTSPTSKIDLFKLMNEGHIILINTAKDLLKESGASLYGRFFLSMIGQAIMERAVIAEDERNPTYLYIDECQDYFDQTIELLLAQGRKYKLGLTLSHQFLDQLTVSQKGSVLANTSIKLVGGINAKDAKVMAMEMGTKPEYLQDTRKAEDNSETQFALWVRNDLPQATKVNVPIGFMEEGPRMEAIAAAEVDAINRKLYSWEYMPQSTDAEVLFPGYAKSEPAPEVVMPETHPPMPEDDPIDSYVEEIEDDEPTSGRGGESHVQMQAHIRSMAQHYGWRAEVEHAVEDGYVDIWLTRKGRTIACEITVTTAVDYEMANIEKCLSAGADEVWLISEDSEKLSTIKTKLGHKPKVWFFTPEQLEEEFEARTPVTSTETAIIRGFEISVKTAFLSNDEIEIRYDRINHILESLK